MQITFDTSNVRDVAGVRAMLDHLHPTGEVAAPVASPKAPLPAADLPSTGVDTAAAFGGQAQQLQPLPLAPAPLQQALPNLGGAIELDAAGLPWDERIHSSTKGKTDAGKWKMRKGMGANPAFVSRIEAEIRATLPSATPAATNVAPVFQQPPVTPAATPAPALQPLPLPVAASPAPAPLPNLAQPSVVASGQPNLQPLQASAPAPTNMQEFMQQIAPLMQSGKATADTINMACMQNNLPGMAALTTATPDQIGKVWAAIPK